MTFDSNIYQVFLNWKSHIHEKYFYWVETWEELDEFRWQMFSWKRSGLGTELIRGLFPVSINTAPGNQNIITLIMLNRWQRTEATSKTTGPVTPAKVRPLRPQEDTGAFWVEEISNTVTVWPLTLGEDSKRNITTVSCVKPWAIHDLQGRMYAECACRSSWAQLFATPWTAAHQAPLSMAFSRQEYWSGLPCPPPGDLSNPEVKLTSSALQVGSLPLSHEGSPSIRVV